MRERERRLKALESWVGTREQEEGKERTQKELFYYVNLILEESHPSHTWNSIALETRWEIFTDEHDESKKELSVEVLRLTLAWIREEEKRRFSL